jgi:ribosomal protein L7/L12
VIQEVMGRLMGTTYSLILRACPEDSRDAVAQLLGRAFSLKDSTCVSIASSTPIVLLTGLSKDEAAALGLVLVGLEQRGAHIELAHDDVSELPKIDWPKRPMIFKREIGEFAGDFTALSLSVPGSNKAYTLLELLSVRLDPQSRPSGHAVRSAGEFKGSQLPEVTPFSNQVLSPSTSVPAGAAAPRPPAAASGDSNDAVSRLNELFPEEDSGFMPNNDDITSILDRLLPDEEQGNAKTGSGPVGHGSSSGRLAVPGTPVGFSVFLAKIADEPKRAKAIPIIAELGKISSEEAEALSKKVIIPVVRGASKEEAEAAKQRFAKIGILARVKGPGG